ncbi:inositol monophosphatase [Ramicandelaber brevisporus]|nr:inositol monophosphatase [Ramicandelaber brevisporus]
MTALPTTVHEADLLVTEAYEFAIEAAKQAGAVIRDAFYRQGQWSTAFSQPTDSSSGETSLIKLGNPADLVTAVDEHVERLIQSAITAKYPLHKFIGEETIAALTVNGQQPVLELTDEPTWIVDPIDGTINFVHSFPFVAVSIAFAVNKQLVIGVVYNPILNELYSARANVNGSSNGAGKSGAWLNETQKLPLIPSSAHTPLKSVSDAYVISEHGSDRSDAPLSSKINSIHRLLNPNVGGNGEGGLVRGVRVLGSGALDMCMIARGSADIYWEIGSHCWDIAAGIVIVRESGGHVFDGIGRFNNQSEAAAQTVRIGQKFDLFSRRVFAIRAMDDKEDAEKIANEFLKLVEDIVVVPDGVAYV